MNVLIFKKMMITFAMVFSFIFFSKAELTNDTIQIYNALDNLSDIIFENVEMDLYSEIMTEALVADDEIPSAIGSMISTFVFPLKETSVSSRFGKRGSRIHSGIDLRLSYGEPVTSVHQGVVTKASSYYSYGNLIIIDHGLGIETYYSHLSKINVKVGDSVSTAQVIGLGGRTGRATGYHLHFEIREGGKAYNPELVFDFDNYEIKSDIYNKNTLAELVQKPRVTEKNQVIDMANVPEKYVIQPGDSLWRISRKFQVTVTELCELNNLSTSSILKVGAHIKVY